MPRAMTSLSFALFSSAALTAPAPFPKPDLSKEQEALYQEAEKSRKAAEELNQQSIQSGARQPAGMAEEMRRLYRRAAEQYTRLASLLEGQRLTEAARKRADEVGLKAAKAWLDVGEFAKALAIYDGLARRSASPETRVVALGGAIACHAAVDEMVAIRGRITSIRTELPRLEAKQRDVWERWLKAAEKELSERTDVKSR